MDEKKFCVKCGAQLPVESTFCPYCMTKFNDAAVEKKAKGSSVNKVLIAIIAVLLVVVIVVVAVAVPGFIKNKNNGGKTTNGGKEVVNDVEDTKNLFNQGGISQEIKAKSVEKDDSIGLMNIKINKNADNLTDVQQLLIRYFDTDYFNAPYNSLQRYPQVYNEAQIEFIGYVTKIIESTDDEYTALIEYGAIYNDYDQMKMGTDNFVVIKGKHKESRFIEGDYIYVHGVYDGVETYTVDGKSYTVPMIKTNYFSFWYAFDVIENVFSQEEIKTISKNLFGDEIKVRYTLNSDLLNEGGYDYEGAKNYYTAELDNQSNANFTKFVLNAYGGKIIDCKTTNTVQREITFSADFEHFYLQIFDKEMNEYTLECYNRNLKKLWGREFEQTTTAQLDYTADHIYLVANGSLYILDAKTGENAVEPKYVGPKMAIRKLEDGILLISEKRSDAVMKTDLTGNVKWTVNLKYDLGNCRMQINEGNYVIQYMGLNTGIFDEYGGEKAVDIAAVITPDGFLDFEGEAF